MARFVELTVAYGTRGKIGVNFDHVEQFRPTDVGTRIIFSGASGSGVDVAEDYGTVAKLAETLRPVR